MAPEQATPKKPPELRLKTEAAKLPVHIMEVRMGRQYVLLTQYRKLTGAHSYVQLNPVTGAMADSSGIGIPARLTSGDVTLRIRGNSASPSRHWRIDLICSDSNRLSIARG